MKTKFSFPVKALLVVSLLVSLALQSNAQISGKPFDIQKPFKKTTYDGKSFKQLRREGINVTKDILKPINNPDVNRALRASKACLALQYSFLTMGIITMFTGISSGSGTGGGAALMVPSLVCGIVSSQMYKKAIRKYNAAVTGAGIAVVTNPMTGKSSPAVRVSMAF